MELGIDVRLNEGSAIGMLLKFDEGEVIGRVRSFYQLLEFCQKC